MFFRFGPAITLMAFTAAVLFSGFSLPSPASAQIFLDAPDLAVRLRGPERGCAVGQRCRFTTTIVNRGDVRFNAPISIRHDARPPRLRLIDTGSSEWTCRPGARQLNCRRRSGVLGAGQRSRYTINVYVPRDVRRQRLRVCAEINWSAPGALKQRNRLVQQVLNAEGYNVGAVDGLIGPQTQSAISQLQAEEGLPITGRIDRFMMRELLDGWGVGDTRAKNDRRCINVPLYDTGQYDAPPRTEQRRDDNYEEPSAGGIKLRCPPKRIQRGRTCVCRAGLVEDETGACLAEKRPRPERKPIIEPDDDPLDDPVIDRNVERKPLPETYSCRTGEVRNAAGTCVCAPERIKRGTRCVVKSEQPACGIGKSRNTADQCVCRVGLREIDGLCQLLQRDDKISKPKKERYAPSPPKPVKQPIEEPKQTERPGKVCKDNMILNENGKCQCYLNLKSREGKCLVKVRAKCLPGEIINVRGKCECPKGREIRGGKCVLK